MAINWTWPGRAHLIVRPDLIYITVYLPPWPARWIWCRRFHWSRER